MSKTEIDEKLRPLRKQLVRAAEENFTDKSRRPPEKAQFSRLLNACASASCAEEIVNYLRYQSSREPNPPWRDKNFAEGVMKRISDLLVQEKLTEDAIRVEAWRLYATYLSRAFTYYSKVNEPAGSRRG